MLRDAALLTLDLQVAALARGWILKDATPYNVLFFRGRPVWIDVPSFVPYFPGRPWTAYAQFCRMFLFPLLVAAHRGIDVRPLLRGRLEGVDLGTARALLGGAWNSLRHRGILTHVVLQAALDRRFRDEKIERSEWARGGLDAEALASQARESGRSRFPAPRGVLVIDYDETRGAERAWKELTRALRPPRPHNRRSGGQHRGHVACGGTRRNGHRDDADADVVDRLYIEEGTAEVPPSFRWSSTSPIPPPAWDGASRNAAPGRSG